MRPPLAAPGARWDPLIRIIAQRRPELARRLHRLRRESPQRFADVLAEALMVRLEQVLDESAGPADRAAERRPAEPDEPRPAARPHRAAEEPLRRLEELRRRHDQLERHSRELAGRLRELEEREGSEDERRELYAALERTLSEQFEVRSELRRFELERLERELHRIQQTLARLTEAFERRERERGAIVERRIKQMLGREFDGW